MDCIGVLAFALLACSHTHIQPGRTRGRLPLALPRRTPTTHALESTNRIRQPAAGGSRRVSAARTERRFLKEMAAFGRLPCHKGVDSNDSGRKPPQKTV